MILKTLTTLFCCAMLLWPLSSQADNAIEPRTITVAYEDDSPPYMFKNEQGEVDGFGIALIKAITEHQGLTIRFKEAPWSETRLALELGDRETDAHTAMGYSSRRAQAVEFGVPYVKDEIALFRRMTSPEPTSIDDLHGKKILVLDTAICHDYLLEFAPGSIPVPVDRWPEVLSRLAAGEADYAMITRFAGLYFIKQLELDTVTQVPLEAEGLMMWYALVAKKGDRELLTLLNEGMTHIQGNGVYDQLYQQWLGVLEPKTILSSEVLKIILWVVCVGAALFTLVLVWSLLLKRLVRLRTQKLEAEVQERKQAEKALRHSEVRFRSLFMSAGIGMSIIDRSGHFISANPTLCQMLDYTENDIQQLTLLDITSDEDAALMSNRFDALFSQQNKRSQANIRYHTSKDELLWGSTTGTVFKAEGDESPLCLYMVEDITARINAENESEQMQQQLQQAAKMEALGQLTGGIAHDFNNMLGSILGYTELAQERCVDDPESKLAKYLRNVHLAGERAQELIAQMMVFSRRDVGVPVLFNPVFLVEEVLTFLQASLPSSINVRINTDLASAPVYMDPVQLQRVLINLCINARDAITELGEICIGVYDVTIDDVVCTACGQQLTGPWVEIKVTDTGTGMEPELLNQIFDPFFTTKGVGKGTGMGLSVVHGVMHEYQGHVIVESQPGHGSTFRLFLPAASAEQETSDQSAD